MKHVHILQFFFIFLAYLNTASAQSQKPVSLVERLGYPANTKLLIIHSDDLAVAHSENTASFKAMSDGSVRSASVMVPCPWLPEVAVYAKSHPDHDLGLHLTLTSEWMPYKWGPVASRHEVKSLVDSLGYFYDNCSDLAAKAKLGEVEKELRAQIEKAKKIGIDPTHLDSHMGCLLLQNVDLFAIYVKLGREYGIPTLLSRDFLNEAPPFRAVVDEKKDIVVDHVYTADPEDYTKGMEQYYLNTFQSMQAGVNVLLIHTASEDSEMQGMTTGNVACPAWCAAWRQVDFNFFTSDLCRKILEEQQIKLITWREVGKLLKSTPKK